MNTTAKQSELLFIWDARMTNPNGDMLNDNAPRFDEVDRKAVVSDVRVKRTVRDDMQHRKNLSIFVNNAEEVQSAETRFKEVEKLSGKKDKEAFLSCIDNRLFGGVAPKSNIQIIGAVQLSWAKSLNRTETVLSQGTVITSYSIHYTKLYELRQKVGCQYSLKMLLCLFCRLIFPLL